MPFSTPLDSLSFQPFHTGGIYTFSPYQPELLQIIDTKCHLAIDTTTPIPQKDNSTNFMIKGHLILDFHYVENSGNSQVSSLTHKHHFLTFLSQPDFSTFSLPTPHILIEDIYTFLLAPQCIYYNITLLGSLSFNKSKGAL